MGKGYKHGTSGGANPLNFTVKTYPSEVELKADKPKENTIGVITTTTMTKWVFSATEPKEPEVGMVWIVVDNSSTVEFNALKKEVLNVYPILAKQYENGKFTDKVSFSYQGEEWHNWFYYILKTGSKSRITGMTFTGTTWSVTDGVLLLNRSSSGAAAGATTDIYSFENRTKLHFTVKSYSPSSSNTGGGYVSICGTDTLDMTANFNFKATGTFSLDISNAPAQGRLRFDLPIGTLEITDLYLE